MTEGEQYLLWLRALALLQRQAVRRALVQRWSAPDEKRHRIRQAGSQ